MTEAKAVSAEVTPSSGREHKAALKLQQLGFRVLHVGSTISTEGPPRLWESTFGITFNSVRQTRSLGPIERSEVVPRPSSDTVSIPEDLQEYIASVSFITPPEYF